ncbi:MAG: hypothetical protein WCF04_11350 [Candidatus Nanopelagicales bacterium]
MNELPRGWTWASVGGLAADRGITDGPFGSNLKTAHYTDAGPRVIRLQNVGDGIFRDERAHIAQDHFESLLKHSVQPGDVLVASLGEVLPRSCQAPADLGPAIVKADVIRIHPGEAIHGAYLMWALNSPATRDRVANAIKGVGRPRFNLGGLRALPLPLAPLPEQERIVAAIEEAFSLLDAGEAGLHATRSRLKRMRDSVLTAAVTGSLVPQDPSDTPAAYWLAKRDVTPTAQPECTVPPGWTYVPLARIAGVKLGRQRSPGRATGPRMRPYLRAANVGWSGLKLSDVKEMDFTESESRAFELIPGDLLLSEASGSPGEVGKPAQFRGEIANCCFQNTLIRVRLGHGLNTDFYEHYFRQQALSGKFAEGSRGVGIHHLGQQALSEWVVPVPPPGEQVRIVAEVERQFSFIDACERAVDAALVRSGALRRSVLKAAFEGRLVEQDPSDEPAAALLERIRSERTSAPGKAPRRGRAKVEAS